jgi:hypothetical protein
MDLVNADDSGGANHQIPVYSAGPVARLECAPDADLTDPERRRECISFLINYTVYRLTRNTWGESGAFPGMTLWFRGGYREKFGMKLM